MDGFRLSNQFLVWPYHGSEDVDRDAHEALLRAAASFHPDPTPPRRRGRPPRIRPSRENGG